MAGQVINGFWTSPFNNQEGHAFRHPAVSVNWENAGRSLAAASIAQTVGHSNLIGMLDTGADLCRIDEGLVSGQISTRVMDDVLTGIRSQSKMYEGKISLVGSDYSLSGSFSAQPFRAAGSQYDIILGMDFLRHFDLTVKSTSGLIQIIQKL